MYEWVPLTQQNAGVTQCWTSMPENTPETGSKLVYLFEFESNLGLNFPFLLYSVWQIDS